MSGTGITWAIPGLREHYRAMLRQAERDWANTPYGAGSRDEIDRLRAILAR